MERMLVNSQDGREEMVHCHLPKILRLCTVILGSSHEAEDSAQEVFIKALSSWNGYRGKSSPSTWLTRIAINVCKDQIRKRKRRKEVPGEIVEEMSDLSPGPMERLIARQLADKVLLCLSPKEELIVRLRFGGDYKIGEIANALSCSESTAKTHLRRAMKKMAGALEHEEGR